MNVPTDLFGRRSKNLAAMILASAAFSAVAPSGFAPLSPTVSHAAVEAPTCWKLAVTPDDAARQAGRDAFVEYLMFDSLGFTAEALAKLGFEPSAIGDAGANAFTSTSVSEDHGTIVWSGAVAGDRIAGTMVWTREGVAYAYAFAGTRHDPG